jgi:hypothetical protein
MQICFPLLSSDSRLINPDLISSVLKISFIFFIFFFFFN